MKRSHARRAIIASLLAIPFYSESNRAIRRSTKEESTPIPITSELNNISHLTQPVVLTPEGIKKFLRYTYNHQDYGSEFLPNNFSHLSQFLRKGKESHQKRAYVQSVFRLFSNKLKSSSYVNAYAFSILLEELPLLADYFVDIKSERDILTMQTQVNEMLYSRFLSQFQSFKANPQDFLGTLSHDIVISLEQHEVPLPLDPTATEELRKTMLMFLDGGLNKLIWSPENPDETWASIKTVATHLSTLYDQNIIVDQEDLNDLFRTLIERYCLFLDITGEDLPVDFFERVKNDIKSQSLLFLDLEEEEDVESKAERLIRSLAQAQHKAAFKVEPKKSRGK